MKIGKVVELEHYVSCSPEPGGVGFTETSGARVFIPNKLIISLYEVLKWDFEKKKKSGFIDENVTWDDHVDQLLESK